MKRRDALNRIAKSGEWKTIASNWKSLPSFPVSRVTVTENEEEQSDAQGSGEVNAFCSLNSSRRRP